MTTLCNGCSAPLDTVPDRVRIGAKVTLCGECVSAAFRALVDLRVLLARRELAAADVSSPENRSAAAAFRDLNEQARVGAPMLPRFGEGPDTPVPTVPERAKT